MKKKTTSQSAFLNLRVLMGLLVCAAGTFIAFFAFGAPLGPFQPQAKPQQPDKAQHGILRTMRSASQDRALTTHAAFRATDILNSAESNTAIPSSGNWTTTGSLNTARYNHTATLLPNGMVLVAGGFDTNGNALASAELYDPASGSWIVTGNLTVPRALHTATLLPDGNVLVAAGFNQGVISPSAELHHPASQSGIEGIFCCDLMSAELYDPGRRFG